MPDRGSDAASAYVAVECMPLGEFDLSPRVRETSVVWGESSHPPSSIRTSATS